MKTTNSSHENSRQKSALGCWSMSVLRWSVLRWRSVLPSLALFAHLQEEAKVGELTKAIPECISPTFLWVNVISSLQTRKRWGFCHGRKPPLSTGAMLQRLDKWIVPLSCMFPHHTLPKTQWLETAIYDYNLYVSGTVGDWLSGTVLMSGSVSQSEINLRMGFVMTCDTQTRKSWLCASSSSGTGMLTVACG